MATVDEVYERMPEGHRRAVIGWVMDQGRHLEQLDEWEMEDNFVTTEGTAEIYQRFVHPHEDEDARCDCGSTRHDTHEDNQPYEEQK